MVALVGSWVKSLIIIVLLGNLAEFILPKGDLKRYAGLVVGLIILVTMLNPLWALMKNAHHAMANNQWLGLGDGTQLGQTIITEEMSQAKAMIMTFPGVKACHVTRQSNGKITVDVTTDRSVARASLAAFVNSSLQVATGKKTSVDLVIHQIRSQSQINYRRKRTP